MPTQAGGVDRGETGKRSHDCDSLGLDTERSSISTTSSATSSSNGRHWTSSSANKLSKVCGKISNYSNTTLTVLEGKSSFIKTFTI